MRLTLRTLLAYLDDILSPAQAKEIGQKISESAYATTLVDRIRDVMRRRRLTAPELDGNDEAIDANLIAEYLDNTLVPDRVADVEKGCLESDIHLAEVAACHQVLTLVLGEPVEIRQKSRERMYALAPWGTAEADSAASTAEPTPSATVAREPEPAKSKSPEQFSETIPDYLKPPPFWRRVLVPMSIVSVIAVWLLLLFIDDDTYNPLLGLFSNDEPEVSQGVDSAQAVASLDESPDASLKAGTPGSEGEQETPADTPIASTSDSGVPTAVEFTPDDPPPPADEPEIDPIADSPPTAETDPAAVASGDQPAIPDSRPGEEVAAIDRPAAEVETPADAAGAGPAAAQPAQPAARIQYNAPSGVLLHFEDGKQDWVMLPHRSLIHPNEQIASPMPFEANLDVGSDQCRVTLLGGTSVVSLPPTSAASFGFDVKEGQLIIEGRSGANDNEVVMAVTVGAKRWYFKLESADAVCGLEVVPRKPNQLEQDMGDDRLEARLYVLSGSVRIADEQQLRAVATAPGADSPHTAAELSAVEGEDSLPVVPISKTPNWLQPGGRQLSSVLKRYAGLFEKEFVFDEGLSLTMPAVLKSSNPRFSLYAAQCLALTGDVEGMVAALAPATHKEARRSAIEGLRRWLPQAPENKDKLHQELSRVLHANDEQVVYRLLWGYNKEDGRNPQISAQLVDWLEHEHITVRQLAFIQVNELTDRVYDYRPLASAGQRSAAVRRWRQHLEKVGSLIQ